MRFLRRSGNNFSFAVTHIDAYVIVFIIHSHRKSLGYAKEDKHDGEPKCGLEEMFNIFHTVIPIASSVHT